MNQKDFYDWKRHPVTQAVFSQLAGRVNELKEILSYNAGNDPARDKEIVGGIKAYNDMLQIEFEGENESV